MIKLVPNISPHIQCWPYIDDSHVEIEALSGKTNHNLQFWSADNKVLTKNILDCAKTELIIAHGASLPQKGAERDNNGTTKTYWIMLKLGCLYPICKAYLKKKRMFKK